MWAALILTGASLASPPAETVVLALSMRHAVPCDEVEALTEDPVEELLWVINNVKRPPWAGMRAADCLIRHHAVKTAPTLEAWVVSEQQRGLGRLVAARLDVLPAEQAAKLARLALFEGPEPDRVRRSLSRCTHPEVQALLTQPAPSTR